MNRLSSRVKEERGGEGRERDRESLRGAKVIHCTERFLSWVRLCYVKSVLTPLRTVTVFWESPGKIKQSRD